MSSCVERYFAAKTMDLFLISFGALFSVINPLGTLPIFLGLTREKTSKQLVSVAAWTSINTLIILVISFFFGSYILGFFGISLNSLKIAGGIIIASSGFALLTGSFSKHKGMKRREKDDAFSRSDIALTPLAIPMLAGPGSISLLIAYHQEHQAVDDRFSLMAAMVLVSAATFVLLTSSRGVMKALGASGINALSRIIGFVVISIGVEYILSALSNVVSALMGSN